MSGLFGGMFSAVGTMLGEGAHESAGGLLGTALSSVGGVQGLIDRADQAGLGDKVRSWVGTGENWPISPAEIERIFPPDQVEAFAEAHGVPAEVVPQVLSHLLPAAVDHATPDGDAAAADRQAADPNSSPAGAQPGASAGAGFDFMSLAERLMGSR